MHAQGICHGRLTSKSVLLDESGRVRGPDEYLYCIGCSVLVSCTGQYGLSPPWSAPELSIASPDEVTMKSDIYSLGVILYEIIAGKSAGVYPTVPINPSSSSGHHFLNPEISKLLVDCLNPDPMFRSSARTLAQVRSTQPLLPPSLTFSAFQIHSNAGTSSSSEADSS